MVALWLPSNPQKHRNSFWPHRLAVRTPASHAGHQGLPGVTFQEVGLSKLNSYISVVILRMVGKAVAFWLPFCRPFFVKFQGML